MSFEDDQRRHRKVVSSTVSIEAGSRILDISSQKGKAQGVAAWRAG